MAPFESGDNINIIRDAVFLFTGPTTQGGTSVLVTKIPGNRQRI